jgi:diaminopropionate ammonia-lyase
MNRIFRLFTNPCYEADAPYGPDQMSAVDRPGREAARSAIGEWSGYRPTPLHSLPGLAKELEVGDVRLKDESGRFGLGSFKALGGAYAVMRVLRQQIDDAASLEDLARGRAAKLVQELTVCCATDGNHGRAVAWGARSAGARCVIFLHEHVSAGREAAIAAYGAEIERVPGSYDDSVRACAEAAAQRNWHVVSDTSYPGYMTVPAWVMHGYALIVDEILDQLDRSRPTHLFVQGGVGGLAAAVIGAFWQDLGAERPLSVVVEPTAADCLYQSALRGSPSVASGDLDTVMACLAAAEVSPLAWQVLECGASAYLTLDDGGAVTAMRRAARPEAGDPSLILGESGAAALGGLLAVAADAEARSDLAITPDSCILVIGSEGATDPEIYRRLVGLDDGEATIAPVA